MRPLRVGIIGMGGFAAHHHNSILKPEKAGRCSVVCACDPEPAAFADRMVELDFTGRGVRMFDDYVKMLDACRDELDVVIIPTPTPLHAEMHKACVERGLAVYLEKPPTLDYAELEQMLEVEAKARKMTNVGFNFIVEKPRQDLKRRILAGEFGQIKTVCYSGLWPRPIAYFQRASWAGRLMMGDQLVLDSCMGNAMAHYVHNTLFWAGGGELFSWAEVAEVEAELYRAHNIEGADTLFVKARTPSGPEIQMALSHACDAPKRHREWVVCEKAEISYLTSAEYHIAWSDGRTEEGPVGDVEIADNLNAYFNYLQGEAERPMTRLVDSRPFVMMNDLAYVAAGKIAAIGSSHITREPDPYGSTYVAINSIDSVFEEFFATGKFPSLQEVAWAQPGGRARAEDVVKLRETIGATLAANGQIPR